MLDQGNRTFIGSVVFVDIVGYSKKSVSEQIIVKDRFTALLSESLIDIPVEQRLILDTGDGAALSFLGDPEDALFVGMNLRDMVDRALAEANAGMHAAAERADAAIDDTAPDLLAQAALPLRIGINLGPVKLVRDINGHPNIVGDGINVAQRIMSFARPGQIVVSRSFFDVVSVISDEYAKLFKYEGSRTDKHVREHEIYIVGDSAAAFKQAKAGTVDRAAATNPTSRIQRQVGVGTGTFGTTPLAEAESTPFLQDRRKLMMAGGVLAVIVLGLALMLALKKPADKSVAELVAATKDATPALSPAAPPPVKTDPVLETPVQAPPSATKPGDAPNATGVTPAPAASTAVSAATTPVATGSGAQTSPEAKTVVAKVPDTAKADAAKLALVEGRINLSIQPWGDVFVNGKSIGVSPPLKQHKLPPGKYRIEVRNTSFTPFKQDVEVKPKDEINVKHKFQ